MARVGAIDIHQENIAAARRAWARVLAVTDPEAQQVMRALWASVWARTLLNDPAHDAPDASAADSHAPSPAAPDPIVQWYRAGLR